MLITQTRVSYSCSISIVFKLVVKCFKFNFLWDIFQILILNTYFLFLFFINISFETIATACKINAECGICISILVEFY